MFTWRGGRPSSRWRSSQGCRRAPPRGRSPGRPTSTTRRASASSRRPRRSATSPITWPSACGRAAPGLLGLVIPDIANPFWAEVARGAQDHRRRDRRVPARLLLRLGPRPRGHATCARCTGRGSTGAIVNPVSDGDGGTSPASACALGPDRHVGADVVPDTPSRSAPTSARRVRLGLDHLQRPWGMRGRPLIVGPRFPARPGAACCGLGARPLPRPRHRPRRASPGRGWDYTFEGGSRRDAAGSWHASRSAISRCSAPTT
jgi:hypothetical protein